MQTGESLLVIIFDDGLENNNDEFAKSGNEIIRYFTPPRIRRKYSLGDSKYKTRSLPKGEWSYLIDLVFQKMTPQIEHYYLTNLMKINRNINDYPVKHFSEKPLRKNLIYYLCYATVGAT